MSLIVFRTPENGLIFDNFLQIAHKIEISKYLANIEHESDSPINFLFSDMLFVDVSFLKIIGGGLLAPLLLLFCGSAYIVNMYSN